MDHKKCNKCEELRTASHFTKDKRNIDGLQGICLICKKASTRAARQLRMQGVGIAEVKEKTCTICNSTKLAEEFFRDAGFSDGRSSTCKVCKKSQTMKWRAKKREEYNEYMRVYRKRHPAKYEKDRGRGLKLRYNITMEIYAKMLADQSGVCAICSNPPAEDRPLYVDHHHKSGKVRKLLCASCNRSIAVFDNPELFEKSAAYIKAHKD